MSDQAETGRAEEDWERTFERHVQGLRWTRRMMRRLPHEPRCKFCFAPFGGTGAAVARLAGFRPSRKNPNICDVCIEKGPAGGFETEAGILFADVRGFTAFAEVRTPAEAAATMQHFYADATRVLVGYEAVIDKLVGDEVMAIFWPLVMDEEPCGAMVQAAWELLDAVGYGSDEGPWLPLGVGVDFGLLHLGNVGPEGMSDFTALGDVVNTAARLQSRADPGQIVVSERVRARLPVLDHAREVELNVKGKHAPVRAYVLEAAAATAA